MPSAVQAIAWSRRPLPFLERAQARYGDVFTLHVRHAEPWVILCDPQDVKRVFTCSPRSLGVGLANTLLQPVLGRRSVMLLEEPEHMQRRKLMLPSFHGERIQHYGAMITAVTRRDMATWPLAEPFALWPRMQEITLDVLLAVIFGDSEADRPSEIRALLCRLSRWLNHPRRLAWLAIVGPRWIVRDPTFASVMAPLEAAVLAEVRRRRENSDGAMCDGIASMLAQARYDDGSLMSDEDLRDELITLLTDGPTAPLLAWAFERLLRHPEKLGWVAAEARAREREVYVDAVVKETMRICPAAPIVVRRLLASMELSGHQLPPDTLVAPCPHLIHRRADIYPQPRQFIPECFLDNPAGTYTWIPFGGGVRRCLAASCAQLVMRRVIQTVLRELDLSPVGPSSGRPQRSAITFTPDLDALVRASPAPSGGERRVG